MYNLKYYININEKLNKLNIKKNDLLYIINYLKIMWPFNINCSNCIKQIKMDFISFKQFKNIIENKSLCCEQRRDSACDWYKYLIKCNKCYKDIFYKKRSICYEHFIPFIILNHLSRIPSDMEIEFCEEFKKLRSEWIIKRILILL